VIRVEAVDATTASDETLRTIVRIETASDPWRWDTERQAVGFMRHPPMSVRRLHWIAFDDDEPVGVARLNVSEDSLAWLNLDVLPERRRRGAGRALFEAAHAAAGGRAVGAHHASADGAAFAAALGARSEQRDVRSELELRAATLDEPALPAGYELRSWIGAAPEELILSFASARNAIDDAPAPEGETYAGWTVERVRDREDSLGNYPFVPQNICSTIESESIPADEGGRRQEEGR
jgi:predicted N-acetyltransferase YhbS